MKKLTLNRKRVVEKILETIGKGRKVSVSKIMREVGYSENYASEPQRLTQSKSFIELLKKVGINDSVRATKHSQLLHSTHVEFQEFPATKIKKKWIHVSDEDIKISIEGSTENPSGCKLVTIQKARDYKRATFRAPNPVVQAKILEMQHKIQGDFAPDKHDVVHYTLNKEEEESLKMLFNDK